MAGSGALVNKSESEKLTLNSLRRNDKTIEEIIETANHVSLYEFQLDTKAWKRRDVEGSLFVVKRSSQPRFQYIILNRLSPSNYVEDILTATDFESENSQYIFYKNDKEEVLGIWFYDTKESEKIFKLLTKMSSTYAMGDKPSGSGLPKDLLASVAGAGAGAGAGGRVRSATTGSSDGRSNPSRSAAAEEISDLLGMLNTNDNATTTTTGTATAGAKDATPGSLEQHHSKSNGNNGKSKKAKENNSRQSTDKRSSNPATKATTSLNNFSKSQLKLALEQVVRKDEFIDMLYHEIVNASNRDK